MKLIKILTVAILVSCAFGSCKKEGNLQNHVDKEIENNLESNPVLSDLNFDFNLSFDGQNIKIFVTDGFGDFIEELSRYAFSEDLANEDKIGLFKIKWTDDVIWVNRVESSSMKTDATQAPCKTQETTVHSADAFEQQMGDIFNQERDVIVEVDFGTFGATISWTFQDC